MLLMQYLTLESNSKYLRKKISHPKKMEINIFIVCIASSLYLCIYLTSFVNKSIKYDLITPMTVLILTKEQNIHISCTFVVNFFVIDINGCILFNTIK